jgi:DNA invertase Pin-like site-specific DNA recombinase
MSLAQDPGASLPRSVLIQDRNVRKTGDSRHCCHQQREQGDRHFLADFRGEATSPFSICLLMRTRRGVSLVQANLTAAGAERIFVEQVSSVASRAKLTECLTFLRDGDVLAVSKPDRLARSTAELLTIEADLSKRGIGLIVLSMGGERLDTRNPTSKLMLTILAGVAAWEREIMLERQREGIAKAKAEGKYKGRPASINATEVKTLAATMGPAAIAKHLGIARSSVYRMLGDSAMNGRSRRACRRQSVQLNRQAPRGVAATLTVYRTLLR